MGRDREKVRERAQERAWKISCFVGGLKSVFQTPQSLGQEFINQAVLLTSHKSRALCTRHLQFFFFFFYQIKVFALRHSKELLPSGLQGHACKEREQTHGAEGYATLSEGRWSILRSRRTHLSLCPVNSPNIHLRVAGYFVLHQVKQTA